MKYHCIERHKIYSHEIIIVLLLLHFLVLLFRLLCDDFVLSFFFQILAIYVGNTTEKVFFLLLFLSDWNWLWFATFALNFFQSFLFFFLFSSFVLLSFSLLLDDFKFGLNFMEVFPFEVFVHVKSQLFKK